MFEWSLPPVLLLLAAVPLLRWLHRRRETAAEITVSSLELWPEGTADAAATHRARRRDPRWRLRALATAALLIAAAGPLLGRRAERRIVVHVDDSPSMRAREGGGTRWDLGARELAAALVRGDVAEVRVSPLGRPDRVAADPLDPASWRDILDGSSLRPSTRRLPAPADLESDHEHWLVTDGVDQAVIDWARAPAVQRVIWVGAATENAAPTRLAVRPDLRNPDRLDGLVQVTNAGTAVASRRLRVVGGEGPVLETTLDLAPGETVQRTFAVPVSESVLRAVISPPDAVPDDDELTVDVAPTRPAAVRLDPRCGSHLRDAISAHPGLVISQGTPALTIWCSERPPTGGALLWFEPDGIGESEQGPPSVTEEGDTIAVRADMESPAWVKGMDYPAFIAGLVDRALGHDQLDRMANVVLPRAAVRIVPRDPGVSDDRATSTSGKRFMDLSGVALVLAAALLLLDAHRSRGSRSVGQRLVVVGLVIVALWNPSVSSGRAPVDVVALVDDSFSVDRGATDERWTRLLHAFAGLPSQSHLTVVRFAADTAVELDGVQPGTPAGLRLLETETLPRSQPLDRTQTDIGRALLFASGRARVGSTVVVVVTDGMQTEGDAESALRSLRAAGIPVLAMQVPASRSDADARVESLDAPAETRSGEIAPVTAVVAAGAAGQLAVRAFLNGSEVAERVVNLRPGQPEPVRFDVALGEPGANLIRAQVERPGDPHPENDGREAVVEVLGLPEVLYVTGAAVPPSLLASLRRGGWKVTALRPSEFPGRQPEGPPPAVLVLDDVAVDEMPDRGWRTLDRLVRRDATGLLVLGGPNSFGAGGYQGSMLEGLLPVTTEGAEPGSRAAILFLVDTSGSMERDQDGRDRLELARQALDATVRAIPDDDLVGLTTFAIEPREIVPLGRRGTGGALSLDLPAASGGTRLAPALRFAVDRLSKADVDQRLLVLLTDGFATQDDVDAAEQLLAAADVQVVALALGSDVRLPILERLARGGPVLRINDAATLPRLVRSELGDRRTASKLGSFLPRPSATLPFEVTAKSWPPLTGYMVSRARPRANVYLESESAEPLLAAHHAGAGRVAVLPGGLGGWAALWPGWSGWSRFSGGLLEWLARPAGNPLLHLDFKDGPRGIAFEVDALSGDGAWSEEDVAQVTVLDPADRAVDLAVAASAPGRFSWELPAPLPGVYRVGVRVGEESIARHVVRSVDAELGPTRTSHDALRDALRNGLVEPWPAPSGLSELGRFRGSQPARPWLILLAVAGYVVLIAREERPSATSPAGA